MAARYLTHFALLVTTFGTKDEAAACAPGPGRGGQEVLDANSFLQLVTESGAALNASGAEEASAGAKPVEEIASDELNAMENIMGKELGTVEGIVENIVGKEMDVMEKSMGDIVDLKKIELGAVKRDQGMKPAGPQKVEVPGPDDESPYPLVPPLTSGAQEEAWGATTNGTRVAEHVLDRRVLGDRDSSDPWAAGAAVDTLNLTATNPALKGFNGGFTDGTYGYAIPHYYNGAYRSTVARFDLATFGFPAALDLAATNPALTGFNGGFTDGTYGYAIPYYKGGTNPYHGTVARFDLATFSSPAALDLAATNPALKGFQGGFADGTYGYAIPNRNGGTYHGTVARFDLATFSSPAALNLTATNPALVGFQGGFTDGTYGYAIPYRNSQRTHGTVARFDLATFSSPAALTLADWLTGFRGGFTDGTYGYAIPLYNGGAWHGWVARFDLATFSSPAALNLAATNPALKGFRGGFTDGTYGYAIPCYNGGTNPYHGTVARFDLATFSSPAALDLTATNPALKGFQGGFTDGTYGYAIPYYNVADYYGTVARFGVIKHVPLDYGPPDTSGRDDQSSVVGDPHVVNVARARFEIRAEGVHKLVQLPRFIQASSKPDLRVDAEIQHLVGNDCSKSFMTSLSIFGRWTEDAAFGLMRISQGSDMPNTTLLINTQSPEEFFKQFPHPDVKAGRASVKFNLRDVDFHVGKHFEGRYGKQRAYLNVRITGLKKYNDLGGLLGYDDHADAEKLDVICAAAKPAAAYQSSLIANERPVPIVTDGGSRIEAE